MLRLPDRGWVGGWVFGVGGWVFHNGPPPPCVGVCHEWVGFFLVKNGPRGRITEPRYTPRSCGSETKRAPTHPPTHPHPMGIPMHPSARSNRAPAQGPRSPPLPSSPPPAAPPFSKVLWSAGHRWCGFPRPHTGPATSATRIAGPRPKGPHPRHTRRARLHQRPPRGIPTNRTVCCFDLGGTVFELLCGSMPRKPTISSAAAERNPRTCAGRRAGGGGGRVPGPDLSGRAHAARKWCRVRWASVFGGGDRLGQKRGGEDGVVIMGQTGAAPPPRQYPDGTTPSQPPLGQGVGEGTRQAKPTNHHPSMCRAHGKDHRRQTWSAR